LTGLRGGKRPENYTSSSKVSMLGGEPKEPKEPKESSAKELDSSKFWSLRQKGRICPKFGRILPLSSLERNHPTHSQKTQGPPSGVSTVINISFYGNIALTRRLEYGIMSV
jgi:hypothetical protein